MFRQAWKSLRRAMIRTVVGTGAIVAAVEVTTHLPSEGKSSSLYHSLSDQVVVPWMRRLLSAEQAHDLAIQSLVASLAPTHRPSAVEQRLQMSQKLFGGKCLVTNPIGLAAGFDKDGVAIQPLLDAGFGFVEIGSVCLRPQPGNPSPRMFRLTQDEAVINRYGFNSVGADEVQGHLQEFRQQQEARRTAPRSFWQQLWWGNASAPPPGLVGVNLGKNKTSDLPLEDYQALIRQLGSYADYLVINVSSPNTPGLRDLQATSSLEFLLGGCLGARNELANKPPLLVKLSPDLSDDDLHDICQCLMKVQVDGIILTNTTTSRPESLQSSNKHETGGLSGKPLQHLSTRCIHNVYQWTSGKIPIIGVGGIFTAQDVYDKLKAGASVVQVYTGLVYQGPGLVSRLRHDLAELLLQNGHRKLEEVVGLDHEDIYWQKRQQRVEQREKGEMTMVVDRMEDDVQDPAADRDTGVAEEYEKFPLETVDVVDA